MTRRGQPHRWLRAAPAAIFLLLSTLTLVVWWLQVDHQRILLERHTIDICTQATRRLHARLESRLRTASIFARRWSTHEGRDFSQKRFVEFSSVLIRELPAYHSIQLIPLRGHPPWVVPTDRPSAWNLLGRRGLQLLDDVHRKGEAMLSPPVLLDGGEAAFFAALPLRRGGEVLGNVVVEFRTRVLIREVFQRRVRSEFHILVDDDGVPLYRSGQSARTAPIQASHQLSVRNRHWRMVVTPRIDQIAFAGWWANLSVPLLGIVLSLGIGGMVHLLARRMTLYRGARDRVLSEMARRELAQRALESSEVRYRSVFNSAANGFLIIDTEHCIVEANPAASQMHGREPGELFDVPYRDLLAPGHTDAYNELIHRLERDGSVKLETVHRRGDSVFDVEVRGMQLHTNGVQQTLVIVTDLSEHKRAVDCYAMLSRKVLMAQEQERARVSRDLHDELGQVLTAVHLELGMVRKKAAAEPVLAEAFGNAVRMLEEAAGEIRRICKGLRPPLLDDLGIEPSARLLVDEFEDRAQIPVTLDVQLREGKAALPMELALCVYRILQESLNNIYRHAAAKKVSVALAARNGDLTLSIDDDGQGFTSEQDTAVTGYGISGMHERATLVGGTLEVRSKPHQGTHVEFRAPLGRRPIAASSVEALWPSS